MQYLVVEGTHTDPNDRATLLTDTAKTHGPMTEQQANALAKALVQRNVDDYYHRAWVVPA